MKSGDITVTTIRVVTPVEKKAEKVKPIFVSLEDAGLEESSSDSAFDCVGVCRHSDWFYDGSSSEYS